MRVDKISPLLQEALDLFPEDKRRPLTEEELKFLTRGGCDPDIKTKAGMVVKVFDLLRPDGTKLGVRAVYAQIPEGKQIEMSYENVVTNPDCVLVLAMNRGFQFDSEVKFWGIGKMSLPNGVPCLLDQFCHPGVGHEFKRGSVNFDVAGTVVLIYEER